MSYVLEITLGWLAVAGILAVIVLIVAVTIATIRNPTIPGERSDVVRDSGDIPD